MASSATVGILRVLLTADTAEFDSAMKRTATSATSWSKSLGQIGRQATQIGTSLTTTLTLPIVAVGAMAIRTGLEFEGAMNAIQGVLRPTGQQMEQVRATAIRMGADTVFSATDAAEAMLELGKAGFDTTTAMASVDEVLQLAAASGMGMADSAALAARALNAFGLKADDLGHVNDVLAKAVNTSSLEIQDLQVAFGYVGPIARGFGMSIEEVSAALGIMRDSGIAAETTGRALREGFSRLANPVKSVKEVMAELGIASFTSNGKLLGLTEVVGLLQSKGLTAAQSLKLFGDAAGPGMFALISKGQQGLIDLTNELKNSEGAAKDMADAMMRGLPGAMERLKGSVETAWLSISKAIEPTVIRVADAAGNLADLITTRLAPAFMALPAPVQTTAIGLLAVSAAAGPVIFGLGQVTIAASAVIGAFGTAGIATRGFTLALTAFGTYLPTFSAALTTVWTSMAIGTTTIGVLSAALKGLAMWAGAAGAAFAGWSMGTFIGEMTGATDAVGKFLAQAGEEMMILPRGTAAQYDASRAAAKSAEEHSKLGGAFDEAAAAAKALKDRVSGEGLARDMATLEGEVNRLNATGGMTPGVLKRVEMEVAALKARGADLSGVLAEIADNAGLVVPALDAAGQSAKKAAEEADKAAASYREFNNWIGERQMEAAAAGIKAAEDFAKAVRTIPIAMQGAFGGTHFTMPPVIEDMGAEVDEIRDSMNAMSSISFNGMWVPFVKGVKDSSAELSKLETQLRNMKQIKAAFGDIFQSIPATISQALVSGGGIADAAKAITSQLGSNLAKMAASALGVTGPFGMAVAGAIGSLAPMISKLWGGNTEHKKVNDLRDKFTAAAGGIEELRQKAAAAGITLERFYKAKTVQEYEAAIKQLGNAFDLADEKAKFIKAQGGLEAVERMARAAGFTIARLTDASTLEDFERAVEDLQEAFDRNRDSANDLFDDIIEAGSNGIPAALRPTIEKFIELGLLTEDQIEQLRALGDATGPTIEELQGAADVLGSKLEHLGPKLAQAKLDAEAKKINKAINDLVRSGGDVGGTLIAAKEELGGLVSAALDGKLTLSESLRPWIEDLVKSGNLVDENGEKITDISKIQWGPAMEDEADIAREGWNKILAKIEELIDKITGPLETALDNVTRDRTINITPNVGPVTMPDVEIRGQPVPFESGPSASSINAAGAAARSFGVASTPFASSVLSEHRSSASTIAVAGARNNYFLVPIPAGAVGDARMMASEVFRQLPSGLETDREGIASAFEQLIDNYNRTYRG